MPVQFDSSHWKQSWACQRGVQDQLKCTILAAGLGRRMDPLTAHHLPKPLFPLGGKLPLTEVWVRRLIQGGVINISMNLCVLKETIKNHFKDGGKFGAGIHYVEEVKPSGTLGGVCKQALGTAAKRVCDDEEKFTGEPFRGSTIIAPSGDIVTDFGADLLEEMYDIHKKTGAALTMVLVPVPWDRRSDFGTVLLQNPETRKSIISKSGKINYFFEKDPNAPSNLNNASIYMIEMDLIKALDPYRTEAVLDAVNPFYDFGKHVFPAMLGQLPHVSLPGEYPLWGVQYDGHWFDVGHKRDYLRVNEQLLDGKLNLDLPFEKLPWGYLGNNVAVEFSKVTIIPPVVIGHDCVIAPGVTLGPYAVVGDGWTVEEGVSIRQSVLWERYPYYTENGRVISATDRRQVDLHQIRRGVAIEECIVTGGTIECNIRAKTVDVWEDGHLDILPIDHVPGGLRP